MALIDADVYYAQLNKILAGSGAFFTDPSDRVLLVKPNYRDHWGWPGGHVDPGESPDVACAREVEEELGLKSPVGRLLVVQWVPPLEDRPYPLVHFLFDCGTVSDGERIVLQAEELDGYGFFSPEEAGSMMPAYLVTRLRAAIEARKTGVTAYLPPHV
jgi:8-oxo-dGTP pyrophosphatase MutT (NUDIX family)